MSKEILYVFQELKSGVPDGFVTHIDQVRGADMLGRMVNITYSELLSLRNNNNLIPGRQYRITDYVTTCCDSGSVEDVITRSAGHVFDIIVTADSVNTLNENARAVIHEGDTYFAACNLAAWQLKYSLDNDTNRFAWADEKGKGVIYYMKDEFDNECYYDFKNIQYLKNEVYYYTFCLKFNDGTTSDGSIMLGTLQYQKCSFNAIKPYRETTTNKQMLNNIILSSATIFSKYPSISNFNCINNNIEEDCRSLYLIKPYNNHIGNNCHDIEVTQNFFNNHIGNNCYNLKNILEISESNIADNCHDLFINYDWIMNVTVGKDCFNIKTIDRYYPNLQRCVFGENCMNVTLSGNDSNVYWNDYFFEDNLGGSINDPLIITNPESSTNSSDSIKRYKTKVATNSAGEVKIYCEADLIA